MLGHRHPNPAGPGMQEFTPDPGESVRTVSSGREGRRLV